MCISHTDVLNLPKKRQQARNHGCQLIFTKIAQMIQGRTDRKMHYEQNNSPKIALPKSTQARGVAN